MIKQIKFSYLIPYEYHADIVASTKKYYLDKFNHALDLDAITQQNILDTFDLSLTRDVTKIDLGEIFISITYRRYSNGKRYNVYARIMKEER